MAVKLSALRAGRSLAPGRFLVLISVRGWVDFRATVQLEWLGQLKNSMTSTGREPATFRLVAQCLKQVRYRAPPKYYSLPPYGSTASFLILYTVGRTPWMGISPSQGRYLHKEQHKLRIIARRQLCLEWNSNPRHPFSSGWRRFSP
jgi:hypothetical protein